MITRAITFVYSSHITDDAWRAMTNELTQAAEQAACDYAAAATNDEYRLDGMVAGDPA